MAECRGLPDLEGMSVAESLSALQTFHKDLAENNQRHREEYARIHAETGIGSAPTPRSLPEEPQGAVSSESSDVKPEPAEPGCVKYRGVGCWCAQCIPSEPLRRGFARLKSAAGRVPIRDGSAPLQFRICWENIWRFFALSMDSADDQTGYLDKFRFEALLQKRAQLSDRAVIKQLWTLAISGGNQSSDDGEGPRAEGKLRFVGFYEFVERWGEESKRRGELEPDGRRPASGIRCRSPGLAGGNSSEKLPNARSVDILQSRQSGFGSGGTSDAGIVGAASAGGIAADWADLTRQRTVALPPSELAQAYSLPTLQPDQKEEFLKGLRRLRKASANGRNSKKEWQKILSKFDLDRSDRLELKQFKAVLEVNSGMHTRSSKWFQEFVPELYKFISHEHVLSLGGITAEEFSRLIDVRTVEGESAASACTTG